MSRTAEGPPSEERRRQIIEAALAVFARKGFDGATNKDIAHEAGVTPGLIYHYFEDKRALFGAIFAEHGPISAAINLLSAPDMQEMDPPVALATLASAIVAGLESTVNLGHFRLMSGEAMRDPEIKEIFNATIATAVQAIAGYLAGQMERGRLRHLDPLLVAQLFLGSLMSCVMRRTIIGDPALLTYSREQIAATAVDLALHGLQPSAGPAL